MTNVRIRLNSSHTPYASPMAPGTSPAKYNYALGYLRACIVALVVAHHAVLAYHPAATPPPVSLQAHPRTWQGWPVFDSQHSVWAGVFATFNDMFFMALMFLVSGLFVWSSLKRKGTGAYLRDRLLRLGVPFVAVAVVIAPLSYYPTYLQIAGHGSLGDFLRDWLALGQWSAGPVWFSWVLLVFDVIAISLLWLTPGLGETLARVTERIACRPGLFFLALVAITLVAYVPLCAVFGPFAWAAWGPFTFQTSRIVFYLVYFFAGIGLGAVGLDRGLLASGAKLARRWPLWLTVTGAVFLVDARVLATVYSQPLPQTWQAALQSGLILTALVLFPVFCAAATLACLALFLRMLNRRMEFFESLSRNSYGIFLIHFVFVNWFGYALAGTAASSLIKFAVVTTAALGVSWIGTSLLRRIPMVAKIV